MNNFIKYSAVVFKFSGIIDIENKKKILVNQNESKTNISSFSV